jgi:hypothetical protein
MHPKQRQPIVQLRVPEGTGTLGRPGTQRDLLGELEEAVTINHSAQALPFSRLDTAQTALSNVDELCRQ